MILIKDKNRYVSYNSHHNHTLNSLKATVIEVSCNQKGLRPYTRISVSRIEIYLYRVMKGANLVQDNTTNMSKLFRFANVFVTLPKFKINHDRETSELQQRRHLI